MTQLKNFDTDLDVAGAAQVVTATETKVAVTEKVEVAHRPNEHHTYLAPTGKPWDWEALRDYVVDQIESIHGPFPRNSGKEYGVFSRFAGEYGADAEAIARYAFETLDGRWGGAPISINRFCKGSDPYFAQPILERIRQAR